MNNYQKTLNSVLKYAKQKDYAGYDKFDALNSPVLEFLSFNNAWLRLIIIQLINRLPFNFRPLFGVKKLRNPKGIGLFIRSLVKLYNKTKDPAFLTEAVKLADWCIANPSPGNNNLCCGYQFIWQDIPPFLQWRFEPNIVVTVFVGEGLVELYRTTQDKKYLDALQSITKFLTEDLPVLHEDENERAVSYILGPVDSIVLNVQLLSGALLAKIWKHTRDEKVLKIIKKQIAFAATRHTDYFAWYYTYPSNKSHIRHDNYHTGGVVDGLLEYYEETGDHTYMDIYWKGLEYYRNHLFEADGAPRWMNDSRYPYDIHGSAQGIISFAKAAKHRPEYLADAHRIADWAIKNLYEPKDGFFFYRVGRLFKWRYTFMRWCNAWMCRALVEIV